jgi:short-subunit dehydrogenase
MASGIGTAKIRRPVAVVTGGSEGIGLAIAKRLARKGGMVLIVGRRQEALAQAAAEIAAGAGGSVATLALDVTSPRAAEVIERQIEELDGYLELLVNNAGVGQCGAFAESDTDTLEHLIALNVAAVARLMRHFLPGLCARKGGGILNIASLGGYVPGPYQAAYYASKAFVISLSEAVAFEVRHHNVKVAVLSPGPVATRFHARMGAEGALYRWVLPTASADTIARWALWSYQLGLRSLTPGIFNLPLAILLRFLPHRLVIPLVALLLRPRRRETTNA